MKALNLLLSFFREPEVKSDPIKCFEDKHFGPLTLNYGFHGREIDKAMVDWLDDKLRDRLEFRWAIQNKDARVVFRLAAEVCQGIREEGGNNCGPMVELIQETLGKAQKEPWCMGFVQTCLAYAECKTGVRSPVVASEHCLTVFNRTPPKYRVVYHPEPGAICIWQYKGTTNGHTGVVIHADRDTGEMELIEGNTEKGLSVHGDVVREGGGIYRTKRSLTGQGKMIVKGFLIPF